MIPESILQKIHNAQTSFELDRTICSLLLEDFSKPGLVILPVGKTYEEGIYSLVNESLIGRDDIVHPGLHISHLDELVLDEATEIKSFATNLKEALPELMSKLKNNFYEIDIKKPEAYQHFLNIQAGARAIYLGLGADPSTAHVAFIGEEYLNREISEVFLSEATSKKLGVEKAVTVGTDIFESSSLERIILTIKGTDKVPSFLAALEDNDTGLGYLLENHLAKLEIYSDHEFAQELKMKS